MNYSITKRWTFDAAHQLPNHDGKCARPHGHTYHVEVTVCGPLQTSGPSEGMVIDFAHLSQVWKEVCEPLLDHQDLNVTLAGLVEPTTAERIAEWIWHRFVGELSTSGGVLVTRVEVWETPTGRATVQRWA